MKPGFSLLASTTLSLEQEQNPWLAAEARFDEAATRLNMDDGLRKLLRTSAKEITVHIPVQLDDGRLEVFTGYRVQHSVARGPGNADPPLHLRDHGIPRPLARRADQVDLQFTPLTREQVAGSMYVRVGASPQLVWRAGYTMAVYLMQWQP